MLPTVKMIMHNELEEMWKELVVVHFKTSSYRLPRRTDENNTRRPGWESKAGSP
jgi:hypothetical protein